MAKIEKPLPGFSASGASALHELKQTLNVMRLTAGNIGMRITPLLDADNAAYLRAKLGIIELQIAALTTRCEQICGAQDSTQDRDRDRDRDRAHDTGGPDQTGL
eukprot:gene6034-6108_t